MLKQLSFLFVSIIHSATNQLFKALVKQFIFSDQKFYFIQELYIKTLWYQTLIKQLYGRQSFREQDKSSLREILLEACVWQITKLHCTFFEVSSPTRYSLPGSYQRNFWLWTTKSSQYSCRGWQPATWLVGEYMLMLWHVVLMNSNHGEHCSDAYFSRWSELAVYLPLIKTLHRHETKFPTNLTFLRSCLTDDW